MIVWLVFNLADVPPELVWGLAVLVLGFGAGAAVAWLRGREANATPAQRQALENVIAIIQGVQRAIGSVGATLGPGSDPAKVTQQALDAAFHAHAVVVGDAP